VVIWIGVAVLILLLVGPRAVSLTTDWLWFSDIGYTKVFSTIIWTRIIVFLVAAMVTAAIVFAAVAVAYRSRSVFVPSGIGPDPLARYRTTVMARIRWFAVLPPLLIGVLAGLVAQGSWSTVQVFLKGTSFGVKDPQFGLDVGFYAFDLPFWRFLLNLLFVIVVVAFVVNLLTHYVFGSIRLGGGGVAPSISMAARVQLSVLAGTFLLLKAVAYWFDRYSLLSSERKQETFTGMSYTDANAVLSSKLILMAIAIICAVAFFAGIVLRDLRVPALATVLMLVSALLIGVGWPLAVEQFSVKPNAAQKEAKYIGRNIAATEQAYGIGKDKVTTKDNWAAKDPDPAAVNSDKATLSNIRILDPNIVSGTYTQLQQRQNFARAQNHDLHIAAVLGNQQFACGVAGNIVYPSQYRRKVRSCIVEDAQMLLARIVRPNTVVAFGGEINNPLVIPDPFATVKPRAGCDLFARRSIDCQGVGQGMPAHGAKTPINGLGYFQNTVSEAGIAVSIEAACAVAI